MANLIGIGLATLFRLDRYRRWVFLYADGEAPVAEQLLSWRPPEPDPLRGYWQPRTADRSKGR